MKQFLAVLLSACLWSGGAWGATYYMRADGSAVNKAAAVSCSAAATSLSIAGHNAETFSAGDIILLCDDGGIFRDDLIVPSSGSAGSPITYSAAVGDTPIITGANLKTPGTSWGTTGGTPANYGDESFAAPNAGVYAGYIYTWPVTVTTGGTLTSYTVNLTEVTPGSNGKMYLYTDTAGAPNALVTNSPVGGQAIDNGTNTFTTSGSPQVSSATTYHIALHTDQDITVRSDGSTGGHMYYKARAYASGPLASITTPTDLGAVTGLDRYITVDPGGDPNIWVTTGVTAEPFTLAINGTWNNQKKASLVAVAADNDWFWDTSDDSVYLYSTSDPDTRWTSPGVEYGVRDAAIDIAKENIVIDGLQALMANIAGVYGSTSNTTTTDNVTIKNSTLSGLNGVMLYGSGTWGWNRIYIDNNNITSGNYDRSMNSGMWGMRLNAGGTFSNIEMTNNTVAGAGEDGISIGESTNSDITITGNTFASNGENCIDIKGTNGATVSSNSCVNDGEANIVVHISSSNVTIENNTFSGCGTITGANDSIQFGKTGHSVPGGIIRYNLIENAGRSGIAVTDSDNTLVYYNVVNGWSVASNGGGIKMINSENVEVYNNTVYGVEDGYRGIQFVIGSPGGIAKNNIVRMTGVVGLIEVDGTSITSFVADNNLYYGESSSWGWNDSFGSFATWKTNSGQDAGAINDDPLFVSAGTDFSLQATSPALNAGVDVGLTADYAGNTVPYNGAVDVPDIGAYEYQGDAEGGAASGCPYRLVSFSQAVACYGGTGTKFDRANAYYAANGCATGTMADREKCFTTAAGCTGSYVDRWQCTLGITGGKAGISDYLHSTYGD